MGVYDTFVYVWLWVIAGGDVGVGVSALGSTTLDTRFSEHLRTTLRRATETGVLPCV